MEELLPLVNKLQDVFHTIGSDHLSLPQIVVIGAQSSGKSSVLENIVCRDFLPRGSGIVTRRPLVLQLMHISHSETKPVEGESEDSPAEDGGALRTERLAQQQLEEYGEFLHLPSKRFMNFTEIRDEIERDTARVAGQNKNISRQPIHLRIFSPWVLNLTLIDLPGITKVPVGEQPSDIEMQIRSLIMDYISKPNSLILAVTPANQDLANSDSLKMAREVDPEGRRTIGVLTKLDLMDRGTNAMDALMGRTYPLRLGFIGVVNRSQQDIMLNKPMSEALKHESEFFKIHSAYRSVAHRCGTAYLAKTLNQILISHIRQVLPDLKAKLNALMTQTQQELQSYGDVAFTGKAHRGSLILKMVTKFANDFNASIDGTSPDITTTQLCGGARIYYIFNSIFCKNLDAINPCGNLSVQDIRTAIRNSTGPRPSLFVPEVAFDLLVKPQIKRLEPPSLRCVELAYEELLKVCDGCGGKELERYPKLHARVLEVVSELLRERLVPTQTYVESLISIQRAYINTNHPDFIGGGGAISALEKRLESRRRKQHGDGGKKAVNSAPGTPASREPNGGKDGALSPDGSGVSGGHPHAYQQHHRHQSHASPSSTGRQSSDAAPTHGPGPHPESSSSSAGSVHGKESFLTYFFGGGTGSKSGQAEKSAGVLSSAKDAVSAAAASALSRSGSVELDNELMMRLGQAPSHLEELGSLSDREEIETQLIRSLIASYFDIVRKEIQDLVPKCIMHLLVNYTKECIQNRLVTALYKEELFNDLLLEDEAIANERTRCKQMLDVYRKAYNIITGCHSP